MNIDEEKCFEHIVELHAKRLEQFGKMIDAVKDMNVSDEFIDIILDFTGIDSELSKCLMKYYMSKKSRCE